MARHRSPEAEMDAVEAMAVPVRAELLADRVGHWLASEHPDGGACASGTCWLMIWTHELLRAVAAGA